MFERESDLKATRPLSLRGAAIARAAALAVLLLFVSSIPDAHAQWNQRPLAPAAILSALRERGFEEFTRPRLDGTTYRLEATNRRGERMSLVVDAYDAEILERGFRDRDDALLPPRDVGPSRGRLDPPGLDLRPDPQYGARPLDDPEDEEEARTDLGDLPAVPSPVYREALPIPQEALPTETAPLAPTGIAPQRELERSQPAVRTNPLALPPQNAAPAAVTPGTASPRPTATRPAGESVASRGSSVPLPAAPAVPAAAPIPNEKPPAAAKPEPKSADASPAPKARSNVRIIEGVAPVIPRDAPAAKPN